ncbi:hypothetical protein RP20_CCG011112 [Aedes albopictus]|nr:uncharacterized protein LOC109400032 [Aedes albopictus]KXJ75755.1 hypothetical protein RP20_CCG011112 [Aedes albopictus]
MMMMTSPPYVRSSPDRASFPRDVQGPFVTVWRNVNFPQRFGNSGSSTAHDAMPYTGTWAPANLTLNKLEDKQLERTIVVDNRVSKQKYEMRVPARYRRSPENDPHVDVPNRTAGVLLEQSTRLHILPHGKFSDEPWQEGRQSLPAAQFLLSHADDTLRYFATMTQRRSTWRSDEPSCTGCRLRTPAHPKAI